MGNNSGSGQKNDNTVERNGEDLLRKLNDLSGADKRSTSRDTITFHGINRYLNQQAGIAPDDGLPKRVDFIHCGERYKEIKTLVEREDLGFSQQQRTGILSTAYDKINRNPNRLSDFGALEKAHIQHPRNERQTVSTTTTTQGGNTPEHDPKLVSRLDALLENPHSYLSLNQMDKANLLKLGRSDLGAILERDEAFVKATANSWGLPGHRMDATAEKIRQEYNAGLCCQITDTGHTNKAPIAAFVDGQKALLRAVGNGFDVFDQYSGYEQTTSLKEFGKTAQAINMAANPVNTQLSARVDSQFGTHDDPTGMTFKNDDVVRTNARSHQY